MKSEAATTLASAAGVSLVTGTVLGLPIAVLAAGFFGGLVALAVSPGISGLVARIVSVAASTITATFMSPYMAAVAHVNGIETVVELQGAAFVIGMGTQVLAPAFIVALKRRIDQLGGGPTP